MNRIHGLHMIYEENRVRLGQSIWSNILSGTAGIPRNIAALSFVPRGRYAIIEADLPHHEFDVGIHWSHRYDKDPANRWLRGVAQELYRDA